MDCCYFTDRDGSCSENRHADSVHYGAIGDFANVINFMPVAKVEVQWYSEKLNMAKLTWKLLTVRCKQACLTADCGIIHDGATEGVECLNTHLEAQGIFSNH